MDGAFTTTEKTQNEEKKGGTSSRGGCLTKGFRTSNIRDHGRGEVGFLRHPILKTIYKELLDKAI